MADTKITALPANTDPRGTDLLTLVDDPGGAPANEKITIDNLLANLFLSSPSGRLTLESGVPISTSDQTGKTTLYFTPYKGNRIVLYDGSGWKLYSFAEISLSLAGYTADKNYDIWAYDSGGAVTLDSTIWTDDTTRATALTAQDGIYVKSGDTTRRYLGTIRINSTGGQCEDTSQYRYVWNYYNRTERRINASITVNWSYSTSAWRIWGGNNAHTIFLVRGLAEDTIHASASLYNNNSSDAAQLSIYVNSTIRGHVIQTSSVMGSQTKTITMAYSGDEIGYITVYPAENAIAGTFVVPAATYAKFQGSFCS